MKFEKIAQQLKEKIDVLERTLLAIDSVNNINQENFSSGTPCISMENTANLLDHLIEPALYQVEALRMMIDGLQPGGTNEKHYPQ